MKTFLNKQFLVKIKIVNQHFEMIFKALMSALVSLGIYLLSNFSNSLDKIQHSINSLNVSIAQIIERTTIQKEMLRRLEERIKKLEEKRK